MAQTTTNYGLLKPEATDSYNHLVYDNPNMDTIDAAMKANSDAAITSATCIKSGTTHTITRANTSAPVLRFTATGDWNSGDTMIVDGVTVTPYLANGDALISKAYLINTEVLMSVTGTRATVYTNANIASNIEYSAGVTVADAITAASTAAGTEYSAGVSVADKISKMETWVPIGNAAIGASVNISGTNYKEYLVVAANTTVSPTLTQNFIFYSDQLGSNFQMTDGYAITASYTGATTITVTSAAVTLSSVYMNNAPLTTGVRIYVSGRN